MTSNLTTHGFLKAFALPIAVATIGFVITPLRLEAANVPTEALLGQLNNPGLGGAQGYSAVVVTPGTGNGVGAFGVEFHGPTVLSSFTFTQVTATSRHRPKDITVYTSPTQSFNFTLDDTQATQTVTLPAPVETSYYLFNVSSQYTTGGSVDPNWGLQSISTTGIRRPHFDLNYVAGVNGATVSTVGSLNTIAYPPSRIVDGTIYANSTATTTYFTRNAGQDSLTITFGGARDIASIGLGMEFGASSRDIPRFVRVLDSNGGNQLVTLSGDPTQYGRYALPAPALGTTSLTIQFPDGSNAADWYLHGDTNYGITEVQAFSAHRIAQIADPQVTAGSSSFSGNPYNSGPYQSGNAFNNDGAATSYASTGAGANTFLDFDFGSPTTISAFEFQPRSINNFDEVHTANLIFSNDPTFTTTISTISLDMQGTIGGSPGNPILYGFTPQTARYVRWDVTGVPNAGGNTGASEIGFFNEVPLHHQQAPTPTVTASSTAFNGSYAVSRLFDNDLDTDYATAASGVNTFVDLDFGSAQRFVGVEFIDRNAPVDWIGSFRLIFSTDATFGNGDDTFLDFNSRSAAYQQFLPHTARYVRFDVLSALGASNNFGGRELFFYVPEPTSLVLMACSSVMLLLFRRKRSV